METPYDRVPYPSAPRSATHPSGFGVNARLLGLDCPSPERASVLEIGCGEGGNLIAMAVGLPHARFHGFDYAPSAVDAGRRIVAALALTNVTMEVGDIRDWSPPQRFDYVVAHGVYAWTPPDVQAALLRLVAECLTPNGVALVSYNVLPGCRIRQTLRDSLQALIGPTDDAGARLAALPHAVAALDAAWKDGDALQKALHEELRALADRPMHVVFHDELGEIYAPSSLSDAVRHAAAAGLSYLADIEPGLMRVRLGIDERAEELAQAGGDPARLEQIDDIADLRRFRHSLFRRSDAAPSGRSPAEMLAGLHVSGDLKRTGVDDRGIHNFEDAQGSAFRTNNPGVIDLIERVGAAFPGSLPLASFSHEPWVAQVVLRLYTGKLVELRTGAPAFALRPGERPVASPLARLQAAQDRPTLSSLRHILVQVDSPAARAFITRLDGTADRTALADGDDLKRTPEQIEEDLAGLARLGLLVA